MGLADRAREPIARFSKGMVQRLALAQAVLAEPDLLVLDEPLEGLDLDARLLLQEIVAEQRQRDRPCSSSRTPWARWPGSATGSPCWSRAGSPCLDSVASLFRDPETGSSERSFEAAVGRSIDRGGMP